jgi:hypothetical protein
MPLNQKYGTKKPLKNADSANPGVEEYKLLGIPGGLIQEFPGASPGCPETNN